MYNARFVLAVLSILPAISTSLQAASQQLPVFGMTDATKAILRAPHGDFSGREGLSAVNHQGQFEFWVEDGKNWYLVEGNGDEVTFRHTYETTGDSRGSKVATLDQSGNLTGRGTHIPTIQTLAQVIMSVVSTDNFEWDAADQPNSATAEKDETLSIGSTSGGEGVALTSDFDDFPFDGSPDAGDFSMLDEEMAQPQTTHRRRSPLSQSGPAGFTGFDPLDFSGELPAADPSVLKALQEEHLKYFPRPVPIDNGDVDDLDPNQFKGLNFNQLDLDVPPQELVDMEL